VKPTLAGVLKKVSNASVCYWAGRNRTTSSPQSKGMSYLKLSRCNNKARYFRLLFLGRYADVASSDETVLDNRRVRHIECALLSARLTDGCE
jgi:hypothetical protein